MKQKSDNKPSKDYVSVKLTQTKLASIHFADVVYGERSQAGAMGNAGGIILYELKDGKLTRFNTNVFDDEKTCLAALKNITKNEYLFDIYYGGMGNGVIVNKTVTLHPDPEQNCFWLETKSDRLRIDASVPGVFLKVSKQFAGEEPGGLDALQKDWEESLRKLFPTD